MERIIDIVLVLVACVLFRVAAGVVGAASAGAGLAGDEHQHKVDYYKKGYPR